jgi:hypothetical protein
MMPCRHLILLWCCLLCRIIQLLCMCCTPMLRCWIDLRLLLRGALRVVRLMQVPIVHRRHGFREIPTLYAPLRARVRSSSHGNGRVRPPFRHADAMVPLSSRGRGCGHHVSDHLTALPSDSRLPILVLRPLMCLCWFLLC